MDELLVYFKLPTVNTQLISRLTDAGFADALPVVLEVFEMEASDRRERRVTAAAVDRLVHHAVILEFASLKSYRTTTGRDQSGEVEPAENSDDNYQTT